MKTNLINKLTLLLIAILGGSYLTTCEAQVIAFSMDDEASQQNTPDGWTAVQLPAGLPAFTADNTFYINDATYGASTSSEDNTTAIQAALDAAANAGGGMVVVPEGTWLTGCLTMGSKTVLHLCDGATLKMLAKSTFPTDDNGYSKMSTPFITGKTGASDIVIEGESRTTSIIDGQGAPWWDDVETAKAAKKSTTRSAMIRFWQGERYLFRNFRIQNAPNTNVTIGRNGSGAHATAHDITIKNPASTAADPSHNTDGFPIWTQYVNIYDCEIDTGDDNVVTDNDAQYVHVWNCDLKAGHGASMGSYTHNMHHIIYEDLTFTDTDCGFRLKSNIGRSGDVHDIIFRNSTMTNVASPFVITSWYDDLPASTSAEDTEAKATEYMAKNSSQTYTDEYIPKFHDILIQNVTVSGHTTYSSSAKNYYGIFIYGRPEQKVYDVIFDNVNITHSKGLKMNFCEGITFYDNCSYTVSNTNQTAKNGTATVASNGLDALIEEQYENAYIWNGILIPLTMGSYLTTSESVTTGTINNNDGGNLGSIKQTSTPTTATFTLTASEAQDMVLTFLTGNNNSSSPQVMVTLNDGSNDVFTVTEDIINTGSWTPAQPHVFDLGNLAAGSYSLKFTFLNSDNSSYVCNLGSIGVYNKTDYVATLDEVPGDITLSKGVYKTAKVESAGNVGYVSNGATAVYTVNNTVAGTATLSAGLAYYGDGTINVKVQDAATGSVEVNKDIDITSSVCQGLDIPVDFELGSITAGIKVIRMTFATSASYLCNYKNVSLSVDASNWKDIAIDLRSGQLGTDKSNPNNAYVVIDDNNTYTYPTAEPASYNAYLTSTKYNGSDHGYVNLKAAVPVGASIYKITLGTCQFGTGTACLKNADESETKNVVDANGQTVTSISQNTGACFHNNTTDNVVSMWYTATSDETITIVCGNYTPYFAIEKVNSVPEMKYSVTYANTTDGTEGTVPSVEYASAGSSVTLPVNRTLYKDGYTLTGWSDGTTTYEPGTSYTPAANVTMTAVFTQNTCTFDQTVSEMTVRWDFQRQNGCPLITMQGSGATAILVQQADVNGNTIDMKMDIDATNGKFANGSWTDWAQVNETTLFTFPSVEGATVKAYSMNEPKNGSDVKSDADGNEYSEYASYIATYATTTASNSSTLTVKGGGYYRYIDVTYPAAAITGITELTVDGVALGSDIIATINTGDAYTATFSDNTYTSVPEVVATFDTSTQATGEVSGTGTSRTYTITQGDKTYTLIIEGIHVYTATGDENNIDIKMNEGTVSDNVWTNGIYTMTTSGIGSSGGADFKFDANTDAPYTISVPADVVVKQFIIKNFHANYSGGDGQLKTVTSTGATTYIPTRHNCVYSGETTAPNRTYEGPAYDLVVTVENHVAGTPIVFTMKKSAQPMGWIQLTTLNDNPGTEPAKTGEEVNVVNNHAAVSVTFDREIPNDVTATINGGNVTAEGGATTLVFPVWNLSYSANYTLTIPANAVEDAYGNKNSTAIEVAVNVPAKAAVEMATYDYVVGNADELLAALDAIQSTNQNDKNAARKTVFLKNGDYNLGSSSETVRWVRSHNLSLIGESRDGVVIHGTSTGISNPVLNLRYWQGFYLQDLTVRNDFDYGTGSFNGVSVAVYGGDKTVMKNVRMQSNQDTQVTGDRAYFEDCKIHGTVDFICGGGDNFYYHTDLILENRGGNVIVAPSTNSSTKWGYVFQECTIKAVDATAAATNAGSYYLGRPWQNEPRSYFLNTTMNVLPNNDGWAAMGTLPTHFYEYNSMNSNGDALDLSVRKNSPTSTNIYTPELTDDEAAKYTLENVLGGTDSWLPSEECVSVAAPAISASGATLSWDASDDARCYVIFKDGAYLANTTETSYEVEEDGVYTVRPANLNGGLGEESNKVVVITVGETGFSIIGFPFATTLPEGVTAYKATAAAGTTVTMAKVTATEIAANTGLVITAEPGDYTFTQIASGSEITDNLFVATGSEAKVATYAGEFYYFAKIKETATEKKVGFKKIAANGSVSAYKAYLPALPGLGSNTLTLKFAEDATAINGIEAEADAVAPVKVIKNGQLFIGKFNIAGQRVK